MYQSDPKGNLTIGNLHETNKRGAPEALVSTHDASQCVSIGTIKYPYRHRKKLIYDQNSNKLIK